MKRTVSTMTMIRSVVDEKSAMSMIPNELLFEIFGMLEPPEECEIRALPTITMPPCDLPRQRRSNKCATM